MTRDNLLAGYKKVYNDTCSERVGAIVDKIFKKVDIDDSGMIEYDEWVLATVDKEHFLTTRYLKKAF